MGHYKINVPLPSTWEQVPIESGAYRRRGSSGVLRISLQPPLAETCPDEQGVSDALKSLLAGLEVDVGDEIHAVAGASPLGMAATSLRRSAQHGLLQFWLVAGQITIFASYTIESSQEAQLDLSEAQQILSGMELVPVS